MPVIDGLPIDENTDFERLAHDALSGRSSVGGALPSDVDEAQGASRFYQTLRASDSPFAASFSRGMAAALSADEQRVRHFALLFFEAFPEAAGGERLCDLADDPDSMRLFTGVVEDGSELSFELMRALAMRLRFDDRALALCRKAALAPGQGLGVVAALTAHDTDWVIAHLEAIILANPPVVAAVRRQLVRAGRDAAIAERFLPKEASGE